MAHAEVKIAAVSIKQAVKKFQRWHDCKTGTCGDVGKVVFRDENGRWVTTDKITPELIERDTQIRAIKPEWYSVSRA